MMKKALSFVCVLSTLVWATGCAWLFEPDRQYEGPKRPPEEVAIVELGDTVERVSFQPAQPIEGFGQSGQFAVKFQIYELLPGQYEFVTELDESEVGRRGVKESPSFGAILAASGLIILSGGKILNGSNDTEPVCINHRVVVHLKAAKTYVIQGDFIDEVCWLWVEDAETGEVVAGSKVEVQP